MNYINFTEKTTNFTDKSNPIKLQMEFQARHISFLFFF